LHIFKHTLLSLIFFLISILIYIELSHFWVSCGGFKSTIKYIELPLLVVLFFIIYFPIKSIKTNILLTSVPIIALYLLYDIFYYFLARSVRVSDLSNVGTLSDFSFILTFGLFTIVLIIFVPIIYMVYKQNKNKSFYFILCAKIIMSLVLFYSLATHSMSTYILHKFDYVNWSQARTIKKNGRLSSFIYYGILNKKSREKLYLFKDKSIKVNQLLFNTLKIEKKKNIYIVILESFIDPRLIENTTFSPSPLSKNIEKYLINKEFSYVKSSVYGGGTAQSEFEILTGIPALSKINSIEFNTLEGNQIPGFLNLLNKNGYSSNAIIASNSGYYNSKTAYKSLGFKQTIFLEESNDFTLNVNDKRIFDGNLYTYSLNKLNIWDKTSPYVSYILGMYGHFPYDRNLDIRPNVIKVTHEDSRVQKIANQFYYRTEALARYIDTILLNDPQSIIYISSDHLPPLLTNGITYKKPSLENIALLLMDGKPIDINGLYYYDIPRFIWKLLQNDSNALKSIDKNIYEDIYFKALSEGLM